ESWYPGASVDGWSQSDVSPPGESRLQNTLDAAQIVEPARKVRRCISTLWEGVRRPNRPALTWTTCMFAADRWTVSGRCITPLGYGVTASPPARVVRAC